MNGWRYASIKGRTDKSRSTSALCGPSGATTGFPQHWQRARTCRVSDLPPRSGALQVWVGYVGTGPLPVLRDKKKRGACGRPGAAPSKKAALRKTYRCVGGDHEMIEHAHIDQVQRCLQRLGQQFIGTAGIRRA